MRATNLNLKPEERIHVWLGNPPMEWAQVTTRAEAFEVLHQTDRYPANLIKSQILDKGLKALVIYGSAHFFEAGTIKSIVEASYPKSFFMITPYIGFLEEAYSDAFEENQRQYVKDRLISPVRVSRLQQELQTSGCHFFRASPSTQAYLQQNE